MRTNNRQTFGIGAVALTLAVGAPWNAALAGDPPAPKAPSADASRDSGMRPIGEFHNAADLLKAAAVNANGETVGEVQDFIFDRGLGQIEYALVKSGAVLGIGGKTIAVRYARLGYDPTTKQFRLDMTREQVERAAEFVPENWADLRRTTWEDQLDELLSGDEDAVVRVGPGISAETLAAAAEERMKGTITSVHRKRTMLAEEQTVVTILVDSGVSRDVLLGPSWYVMGSEAAPMRGDAIEATARVLREDGKDLYVASAVKINGDAIPLRDKALNPEWKADRTERQGTTGSERTHTAGSGRLMLMSDLLGAKAMALDKDGGSVHDAVIERRSGRIAIIGFDPNENFLGLGDKDRCVPWPVVSVRDDDVVVIDATSHMLESCQPMPEDVAVFAVPGRLESVYGAFQIDADRFEPVEPVARSTDAPSTFRWLDAARRGVDSSFTGTISGSRNVAVSPGEPEAGVISVSVNNEQKSVVLGPVWYVERQRLDLDSGDTVTIAGRTITIDGRAYVVARTITIDGATVNLWDGNHPAWASR